MGRLVDRRWDAASRARLVTGLLCLVALWLIGASVARADSTVQVNTTNGASTMGDGLCSLPEAVAYADPLTLPPGNPEPDCAPGTPTGTTTIKLPADATKYTVPSTLMLNRNTNIVGGGAASTTIDGGGAIQVLNIAGTAQVTLTGVTISGGASRDSTMGCTTTILVRSCPQEDGLPGGGIANAGTLTLQDAAVTGNATAAGVRPFSSLFFFCFGGSCPGRAGESAGAGGNGGGIYNQGQLTITDSTIAGNTAGSGGNATSGTAATGADTSVGEPGGNGGYGGSGGGLYNDSGAVATITDSTISGNAAGNAGNAGDGGAATIAGDLGGNAGFPGFFAGNGGGIYNLGTLTVSGSTVAANVSGLGGNGATGGAGDGVGPGTGSASANGGSGGGIASDSTQTVTLTNSTIAGNTASAGGTGGTGPGTAGSGGGIYQQGIGLVALAFDTVDGNQAGAGGGLFHSSVGSTTEAASIIASNTGSPAANCGGPMITDDGNNLVFGDNSCPGTAAVPKLAALADNGGPTQTMALQAGSGAVDLVPANACPQTTDQRGVTRPQGTACDAGAYELAPPSVGGVSGTATSTTTASVTATVIPNLKSTTVSVSYGPTTAYGQTTTPQTFAGNTSKPFSAPLTGLSAQTTYHARVMASNGDGTTNSSDLTFTTPAIPPVPHGVPAPPAPRLSAAVVQASTSATRLSLTIACGGGSASARCTGPVTIAYQPAARTGKAGAVAAATKKKPKPKPKPKAVRVAAGAYSVLSGRQVTIKLVLNAAGRRILTQRYRLPTTLSIGGTTRITRSVTFSYKRISSPISFTWSFNSRFSVAEDLTISHLPAKPAVVVICRGGGCPFAERTFHPKGKKLALAPALVHSHLAPHTTLELQINSRNQVGKVLVFTIRKNKQPTLAASCLAPGAAHPAPCA